jgi:hypothetical protein
MNALAVTVAVLMAVWGLAMIVGLLVVDYQDERAHRQQMVRSNSSRRG